MHGLHEYPSLPVDEPHVLDDLLLGVEQLDALRVRVVARREGPRVRRRKFPAKDFPAKNVGGDDWLEICLKPLYTQYYL